MGAGLRPPRQEDIEPLIFKLLLLIVGGIILIHQVVARVVRRFWHFPAPAFISHVLDSKLRRRTQPPEKLIEWSGIAEGMTVLDPFLGSGTTCLAAELEGRNSIGYEINPDFEPMIREKLAGEATSVSFEHR